MTLYRLKQELVDEKQLISNKNLYRMVIRTVLFLLLLGISTGVLVTLILDYRFTLLILVLVSLLFLWIFDYCAEDVGFLNKWFKFSKFWWLGFIFVIFAFVILKMTNFM